MLTGWVTSGYLILEDRKMAKGKHIDRHPEHFTDLGPGVLTTCPECGHEARLRGPSPAPTVAKLHQIKRFLCEHCGWWVAAPDNGA